MVKVFAPMLSLDASGTLGDAVTFSKWKGRNYVRERVIPANPETGAQVGRRAMFKFLTQRWQDLSNTPIASWQDLADQLIASTFNAYVSYNLQRWHNFLPPHQTYPPTPAGAASDNVLTSADWDENRVKLTIQGSTTNQMWGIIVYAKLAGAVTPAVGNAILITRETTIAEHFEYWTPPTLGRWYFNSMTFNAQATMTGAGGAQDTGA